MLDHAQDRDAESGAQLQRPRQRDSPVPARAAQGGAHRRLCERQCSESRGLNHRHEQDPTFLSRSGSGQSPVLRAPYLRRRTDSLPQHWNRDAPETSEVRLLHLTVQTQGIVGIVTAVVAAGCGGLAVSPAGRVAAWFGCCVGIPRHHGCLVRLLASISGRHARSHPTDSPTTDQPAQRARLTDQH
jgi:hypothetical protein